MIVTTDTHTHHRHQSSVYSTSTDCVLWNARALTLPPRTAANVAAAVPFYDRPYDFVVAWSNRANGFPVEIQCYYEMERLAQQFRLFCVCVISFGFDFGFEAILRGDWMATAVLPPAARRSMQQPCCSI